MFLLPESVGDYVGVDDPVRFIDAFVDELDLAAAGFVGVQPKAAGRPGYAPADLLKLYIYGYLNRVRSSRRLEMECHRNIEAARAILDVDTRGMVRTSVAPRAPSR
jgi:transposase